MSKQPTSTAYPPPAPQFQQPHSYGQPPPPQLMGYGGAAPAGYHPPPPGPGQFELTVIQGPAPLNLNALVNLSFYTIRSTGISSRMACDAEGQHVFSQNEMVSYQYLVLGYLNFVDNTGYQFLKAELTGSGTRIMSGDLHLGTLDAITPYSDIVINAKSSVGLGSVQLNPKDGCCISCYVCCVAYCGSVDSMNVLHSRKPIGRIKKENGVVGVSIKQNVDARVKALVVVASFMMYNTFWK